jgi:hypothetical protein
MVLAAGIITTGGTMEGEGNFFTRKMGPFPAWVWLAGAAVIAYFLFARKSSAGSPTTSGGGGQITTGNTKVMKGAVTVNVSANGADHDSQSQPGPKPPPLDKFKVFTVPKDETFGQFGEGRNWSEDTFDALQNFPQPKGTTYAGQTLPQSKKLKKGDKIARPIGFHPYDTSGG